MRQHAVRTIILLALTVFLPFMGYSATVSNRMKVAVIEFQVKGLEQKDAGYIISEWVLDSLNKLGVYNLVERISLSKIIDEQKLTLSGMINDNTAAKIGQFYGLEGIVVGNVMKLGTTISVTARLIDVKTASIVYTASITVKDMDELSSKMDELTLQLVDNRGRRAPAETVIPVNYAGKSPLLDLAVPGLVQFQADDGGWGALFLSGFIGGAGLVALSQVFYMDAYGRYQAATDPAEITALYGQAQQWQTMTWAGIGVWALSALASTLHAAFQPSAVQRASLDSGFSINAFAAGESAAISIAWRY